MEKPEIIAIVVIAVIIASAVTYIIKEKKSGRKCIGCPDGGKCQGSCSGCSACSCGMNDCGLDEEETSSQE